jgi:hypothetical protein
MFDIIAHDSTWRRLYHQASKHPHTQKIHDRRLLDMGQTTSGFQFHKKNIQFPTIVAPHWTNLSKFTV